MTKNKSVDLGIDTFMQSVAENKPAGNNEPSSFSPNRSRSKTFKRTTAQNVPTFRTHNLKLDEKTYKDLSIIKALNRLDIQDIVFAATVKFLKEYNTDCGLTDKGIELVKDIKDQYEK